MTLDRCSLCSLQCTQIHEWRDQLECLVSDHGKGVRVHLVAVRLVPVHLRGHVAVAASLAREIISTIQVLVVVLTVRVCCLVMLLSSSSTSSWRDIQTTRILPLHRRRRRWHRSNLILAIMFVAVLHARITNHDALRCRKSCRLRRFEQCLSRVKSSPHAADALHGWLRRVGQCSLVPRTDCGKRSAKAKVANFQHAVLGDDVVTLLLRFRRTVHTACNHEIGGLQISMDDRDRLDAMQVRKRARAVNHKLARANGCEDRSLARGCVVKDFRERAYAEFGNDHVWCRARARSEKLHCVWVMALDEANDLVSQLPHGHVVRGVQIQRLHRNGCLTPPSGMDTAKLACSDLLTNHHLVRADLPFAFNVHESAVRNKLVGFLAHGSVVVGGLRAAIHGEPYFPPCRCRLLCGGDEIRAAIWKPHQLALFHRNERSARKGILRDKPTSVDEHPYHAGVLSSQSILKWRVMKSVESIHFRSLPEQPVRDVNAPPTRR
mmetsp:Transcript_15704/g.39816  ORF Transcript_15704/g.39816 Transcript_15704/m.39816 type:complete len:492 (+) Transcript_15704:1280-2755(+)